MLVVPAGQQGILLDYPVDPEPRYGYAKPPHAELHRILRKDLVRYYENLDRLLPYCRQLASVPAESDPQNPTAPFWGNTYLSVLDAMSIYCFIAERRPATYLEVGSGNSTLFARRAIQDQQLATSIVSIDPCPRVEIEQVCQPTRAPLEDVDLSVIDQLGEGDVLFVDNSHRSFMNSDVTVFFLDVLPRLRPGVLVGLHDIYLPYDYPAEWKRRYYSEQYLLAAFLLAEGDGIEVELPLSFAVHEQALGQSLDRLLEAVDANPANKFGSVFWFSISPSGREGSC